MQEKKERDQGQNPGPGEHEKISSHDTGDGSARPYHRDQGFGMEEDVSERRAHAAYQVKKQEFSVAEGVLYVVSEYPEKQHIYHQVKDAPVEKHGSEQGAEGAGAGALDLHLLNPGSLAEKGAVADRNIAVNCFSRSGVGDEVRNGTILKNRLIQSLHHLKNEDQTVDHDQADGKKGNRPGGIDVFERNHGSISN